MRSLVLLTVGADLHGCQEETKNFFAQAFILKEKPYSWSLDREVRWTDGTGSHIVLVDLAGLAPPSLSFSINGATSSQTQIIQPIKVQPFVRIEITPEIRIIGGDNGPQDLSRLGNYERNGNQYSSFFVLNTRKNLYENPYHQSRVGGAVPREIYGPDQIGLSGWNLENCLSWGRTDRLPSLQKRLRETKIWHQIMGLVVGFLFRNWWILN